MDTVFNETNNYILFKQNFSLGNLLLIAKNIIMDSSSYWSLFLLSSTFSVLLCALEGWPLWTASPGPLCPLISGWDQLMRVFCGSECFFLQLCLCFSVVLAVLWPLRQWLLFYVCSSQPGFVIPLSPLLFWIEGNDISFLLLLPLRWLNICGFLQPYSYLCR